MLFSSSEYLLVFLPITVLGYFWLNRAVGHAAGKAWIVLASLLFYSWWSLAYLWLMTGSVLFNYFAGRHLAHLQGSIARIALGMAVLANLGLLGYYKYADFFISNLSHISDSPTAVSNVVLPLGISFFTFTQIAYLVDVYRNKAREYSLLNYVLFVAFFPHLIAGPILHHGEMMPQFNHAPSSRINWQNLYSGAYLIGLGLFKKAVLADSLSPIVSETFDSSSPVIFHQAWIGSLAYTLQLYFDFSGYTDIAIGSALMFNIRMPVNFNSPYKAQDIQDFWRRWHMTLSRWLRDYLYIPLGGSRNGLARCHAALIITFVLGGLWHGANWTFIIWGLAHGAATVVHKSWRSFHWHLPPLAGWALTFLFVNATWVLFRADTLSSAGNILQGMCGLNGFATTETIYHLLANILEADTWNPLLTASPGRNLLMSAGALAIAWWTPNSNTLTLELPENEIKISHALVASVTTGFALFYLLFLTTGTASFIYFYF